MTTIALNPTHDPALTSWVSSANSPSTDFPIQNLPFAVFKPTGSLEPFRGGVAIGDQILDLAQLAQLNILTGLAQQALQAAALPQLNALMDMGQEAWSALRASLSNILRTGAVQQTSVQSCLISQEKVSYDLPARIRDYTDFYTSIHHATSVGRMFRPDNPLLPNYQWVPIGYHGRASSIGVGGGTVSIDAIGTTVQDNGNTARVIRPKGQLKAADAITPILAPCKRLDYELELGVLVGQGNPQGQAISIDQAPQHVFGMVILNDWSARDIQAWEYQPLGPFLAKNFATTISPWVVTLEALAPYRTSFAHPAQDPQPLPYLTSQENSDAGAIDITIEAYLQTQGMRSQGLTPQCLSRSNYANAAYWTVSQLIAHHTVNGCNLASGDLLGTGTLSGPTPGEAGSLLELSQGGKVPVQLPNAETRTFLEDGDSLILNAYCHAPGKARVGFGHCVGTVVAGS